MKYHIFNNRVEAGKMLANELLHYKNQPGILVLGLPRGGVPVACEVADALGAELDVVIVRKLGHPLHPEFAIGAIASGDTCIFNDYALEATGLESSQLDTIIEVEKKELNRRETRYRGDRPPLELEGRTIILVDDGLATGATMSAAIKALRQKNPARIVAAIPVGSIDALQRITNLADKVICLQAPVDFSAVGQWYRDFGQTSDDEVIALLNR